MYQEKDFIKNEKNSQKLFLKWLLFFLFAFIIFTIMFSNYSQETLICSKTNDICFLERTNLFGYKSSKPLIIYSQIKRASFSHKQVKGNRFGKGYTSYRLIFYNKANDPIEIFSTFYIDSNEVKNAVNDVNKLIKTNDDYFEYNRN